MLYLGYSTVRSLAHLNLLASFSSAPLPWPAPQLPDGRRRTLGRRRTPPRVAAGSSHKNAALLGACARDGAASRPHSLIIRSGMLNAAAGTCPLRTRTPTRRTRSAGGDDQRATHIQRNVPLRPNPWATWPKMPRTRPPDGRGPRAAAPPPLPRALPRRLLPFPR